MRRIAWSVDSEYKPLRAVALSRPHLDAGTGADPSAVLHSAPVDGKAFRDEFLALSRAYRALGVALVSIDPRNVKPVDRKSLFNLMFTRDHFFMTPKGAIIGRMASRIRSREPGYAAAALRAAGVPVRAVVDGGGTFEGADCLWAGPGLVIAGVGKRTNREGYRQVSARLRPDGVRCVAVPAPVKSLHLLGSLQFVDASLAVVRGASLNAGIRDFLRKHGFRTVVLPESAEVAQRHAMNFVTVAPRQVLMARGCPRTERALAAARIRVIGRVQAAQYANAGGGIACAGGILAREP